MAGVPDGAPTHPSLLARLRDAGDVAAWKTFVEVYGPLVYGHCRRSGLSHEDAEDVTQEVFARVSEGIRSFQYQPEVARFRTWLGTVVRNEVSRFFKKKGRAVNGTTQQPLDALEATVDDSAWTAAFNARLLEAALVRCRPHFEDATWRAFELAWIEDRPAAQVAGELGQALDQVYVAKSRVLKRLWQDIQELADDSALPLSPR